MKTSKNNDKSTMYLNMQGITVGKISYDESSSTYTVEGFDEDEFGGGIWFGLSSQGAKKQARYIVGCGKLTHRQVLEMADVNF